jgi:hypothetical protein
MADPLAAPLPQVFQDLVPWGDPYVVGLIQKLQQSTGHRVQPAWPDVQLRGEAPPPLLEPDMETYSPYKWGDDRTRRF